MRKSKKQLFFTLEPQRQQLYKSDIISDFMQYLGFEELVCCLYSFHHYNYSSLYTYFGHQDFGYNVAKTKGMAMQKRLTKKDRYSCQQN